MGWSAYFWVRSAGFPFEWLDDLGVLVDSPLLERHEALDARIAGVEERLRERVLHVAPQAAVKLERRFKDHLPVSAADMPQTVRMQTAALFDERTALLAEAAEGRAQLTTAFQAELLRKRQDLLRHLADPWVREAVFLSNPESLQRLDALQERGAEPLDSRGRQRLRLGWNYLQRLCAKNDTSSFFGPIAWGRFGGPGQPALQITQAQPWLHSRKTVFEHWLVLRLARGIASDPALCDALPVRMSPGCDHEEGLLHVPLGRQHALDPLARAVCELACRPADQCLSRAGLVAHLAARGFDPVRTRAVLEFLLEKKVLLADLVVPPGGAAGLAQLGTLLAALPAPAAAKAPWLSVLDALEAQRLRFAQGDLALRMEALQAMQRVLAGAGVDLSRIRGQMYVGRLPVYEDCGRSLQVRLGGSVVHDLQVQAQPVMALYGWLAGAVAARLHDHYLACWAGLIGPEPSGPVDFLQFLHGVQAASRVEAVVAELRGVLQACWLRLAAGREHAEEIPLSPADLDRLLADLCLHESRACSFPGLASRVHSPDFLLAAADEAAVTAGDYRLVVGEVHPAVHTLSQPVAQPFCPDAEGVREEVEQLLAPRTLVVADSAETYQRSHIDWLDVPSLSQVILPGSAGRVPLERCLPAGRGQVVLRQGLLTYVDRASRAEQDVLTLMPSELHRACFALAADLIGQCVPARITVGRVILKRRSWDVAPGGLPEPGQPGEDLGSHLRWRQWARSLRMPRFVFVKVAGEPKPIYVDFHNPFALDLLANLARGGAAMRVSEMRPHPGELWLRDERGRYCCEFRTSCVLEPRARDPQPASQATRPAVRAEVAPAA